MTKPAILLIYTGGTIGMMADKISNALKPISHHNLLQNIPEIGKFNFEVDIVSLPNPIDSSEMAPKHWVEIAEIIGDKYEQYTGFVILHGSDTMAYTASALSFMFENLSKPVILTGSQLPIGFIRSDGRENLLSAIEIAAAHRKNRPIIQEVAIYFEYYLYRGNRSTKFNAEQFEAFDSPNYPVLAEAGVNIRYFDNLPTKHNPNKFVIHKHFSNEVISIKLFPGINSSYIKTILSLENLKGVIIETFGSGNAPINEMFIGLLKSAIARGVIICNVSQCLKGSVNQGQYETSIILEKIGVISGHNMTFESAITKLMYLIGQGYSNSKVKTLFQKNIRGELG